MTGAGHWDTAGRLWRRERQERPRGLAPGGALRVLLQDRAPPAEDGRGPSSARGTPGAWPGQPRPAFLQGERVRLDCGDLPGPEAVAALEDLDDIFLLRVLPGAPHTPLTPRVGL